MDIEGLRGRRVTVVEVGPRDGLQNEKEILTVEVRVGYVDRLTEAGLPAIEAAINADQWKVIAWFPSVKVRELSLDEVTQFDPSGLAFSNVNSPEEFAEAERLVTSQ